MEAAISLERQVTKYATVSVTYLNSRGEHQIFLRNANAPFPGTYNPDDPTSGIRPFGGKTNIYQYSSEGIYKQNQMIVNGRVSVGRKCRYLVSIRLNFADSDLGQAGGVDPRGGDCEALAAAAAARRTSYELVRSMEDYGRAKFDVRNRGVIGGTISLPYALRLSPFILADSGTPFNIVVGPGPKR